MKGRDNALLEVQDLSVTFDVTGGLLAKKTGEVRAVDGVSFSLRQGETFGLVGESGCGKTTTGKSIIRVIRPTGGKVIFDGTDISSLSEKEMKPYRRQLQMIFQDPYGSLDPRQSVEEILREVICADRKQHGTSQIEERIRELLSMVELSEQLADRYPHEMSGGQRQRLGIARALACEPRLIVCDEPVSALDVSIQAQIINLFQTLQKRYGFTYVFVAHDLAVVRHIADTIGVMYLGKLVEVFDADKLYSNPMHPYTKALLSAVPTTNYTEEHQRTRIVLGGEVPSPMHVPSGCPFHPRCRYATDECKEQCPQLQNTEDGHQVACFHAGVADK